jgi:nucleoprotein TPR
MARSEDKIAEMTREVEAQANIAKMAQENYERELNLHSAARTSVREARDELEAEKRLRANFENEGAAVKNEVAAMQAVYDSEKEKLVKSVSELEEQLELSRKQNGLLHSQIKVLGDAADKLGEGAKGGGGAASDAESELRQLVSFMKNENEMAESKVQVLKHELECERAACSVAKRSLDEARSVLKLRDEQDAADLAKGGDGDKKIAEDANQVRASERASERASGS